MSDDSFSLKQFITASLKDICEAINDVRSIHPHVAPADVGGKYAGTQTDIEFDIAVTVSASSSKSSSESIEGDAGGNIIQVIKAGVKFSGTNEKTVENAGENVSRIKFKVPVFLRYSADKEKAASASLQRVSSYDPLSN